MRDLYVPNHLHEFTAFGAAVDLYGYLGKNRPAKQLTIVAGTGTISVKMSGGGATTEVLTVAVGAEVIGEFMSIVSVTGVTNIRAGWN